MSPVRTVAVALSVLFHGSLAYGLTYHSNAPRLAALDNGGGNDLLTVELGIALEGSAKLGDAVQTMETAEVKPVEQYTPPPIQEVKPDELRDLVTAREAKIEENIVKATEPPPPVIEPPKPTEVEVKEQPAQVAMLTEQSSGAARTGGSTTARSEYLGTLRGVIEKAKINPRSKLAGTVVVRFKIGVDGELISREIATSSGSDILDKAAVAALDRAAPFPKMPREASNEPLVVSVPFKFVTR